MLAIALFLLLGAALGALLGWASMKFHVASDPRIDQIESLLPGGQCGQCGYAGCRQAAQAIIANEASVTLCPPGGPALVSQLAAISGQTVNADDAIALPKIAMVQAEQCSGCMRCSKACPFDAIIGANKQIHGVLQALCTGCGLCQPVCPQSCIQLQPTPSHPANWQWPLPLQS